MKIAVLFVLCCLLQLPTLAQGEKCERRFRVAVNNFKPLYSADQYGQLSGLTYDLIKEIERRDGCLFQQQPTEFPRMNDDFKNWRTDIIAFIAESDTLNNYGTFHQIFSVRRKLLLNKSFFVKGKKIGEYLNDPKIKFSNQIGAHPLVSDAELEVLKKQDRTVQAPSPNVSYQMIEDGRVQAAFTTPILHYYYLSQHPGIQDKVVQISDPDRKVVIGLYISKKRINGEEAARIQKVIEEMRKDGTLHKILLKYMKKEDIQEYEGVPEKPALFGIISAASASTKKCERQFRVSVNAYPPFYSVNRSGEVSGLSYDIVKELERRFGCTFNQQASEIPRMFEDFKNWRVDIIAFMAANETAAEFGNFIELYTVHRKLVIIKSSYVKGKSIKEYLNDPKIKFTNQIFHPLLFTTII
jgi:ABC-type amino acid transport substrate-binding protein